MIASETENLLAPLERFEAIRRSVVRLGNRLCDLSYANPYGNVDAEGRNVIRRVLEQKGVLDLQYSPFGGQTLARRAVADALASSHGTAFAFRDVILTPGAMAALQVALHATGDPGDEVIIPVPCWLDHPLYVQFAGRSPVLVPLKPGSFDLDLDAIGAALSERTCSILLTNPANPTGRLYGPSMLRGLAAMISAAQRRTGRDVTVIADESHRDFASPDYPTMVSFFDRTLVVYSFGKYHFMQGQRIGYVAVSPNHPRRRDLSVELERWMRITGLATPTALMQRCVPDLLALHHDLGWVHEQRQRTVRQLTVGGYYVVPPDGTLFIYVRTPPNHDDFTFAAALAHSGVLVLPAPVFHHQGYFRISLTGSEGMLERAMPILAKHAG